MEVRAEKKEIAKQLQAKINAMQGLGRLPFAMSKSAFAPFNTAFPNHVFPIGTLHEFISDEPADAASTSGFMTALIGKFIKTGGLCLWISSERKIFPATLKQFGVEPDRVIFICAPKPKEALWIAEEAMKCEALTAVVGEIKEMSFTVSRRFQLAVERSGVTGFIHRYRPLAENAVACTARWRITPLPSQTDDGLPGMGHSCWNVQLLKVKNGMPDSWQVSWRGDFMPMAVQRHIIPIVERHAG